MQGNFSLNECLKILDVNKDATVDDIKKAYRRLAKQFHPDIAGRDEYYVKKFREITKAYKTLIEAIDNGKIISEKDNKFSVKEFLNKKFRIKDYLNLFRFRKNVRTEEINFGEVFLKRVSPEILNLNEDELILRLEGTINFYVMLEAIKALNKLNSKRGYISIIENFYKYPSELKKFTVFILKKRIDKNIYNKLDLILKKGNYETTVSIIGFLYELHDKKIFSNNFHDRTSRKLIKSFIKNHMQGLKNIFLLIESLKVKLSFGLNISELKLGEKLVYYKKISPYQLVIALTIKEKFQNEKIGKILLDLNFISINDLKNALR